MRLAQVSPMNLLSSYVRVVTILLTSLADRSVTFGMLAVANGKVEEQK